MSIISGPVPAFNNPPIQPQFYVPHRYDIQSISRGDQTLVQTAVDNDYVVGQLVRFLIPKNCGIRQLNEQQGYVVEKPASDQIIVDINSKSMDAFILVSTGTKAQIISVGDINSGQINSNGRSGNKTYVPGSFINISPV